MKNKISTSLYIVIGSIILLFTFISCDPEECPGPPVQENVNEDIYVAGGIQLTGYTQAAYWKNGVPFMLNEGPRASMAYNIFLDYPYLYVAGSKKDESYMDIPVIWENHLERELESNGKEGEAYAVAFKNNRVFAAGYVKEGDFKIATLWNPFSKITIGSRTENSVINAIYVTGNEVHMVGKSEFYQIQKARYWIFNYDTGSLVEVALPQVNNGVSNSARGITIKNNKVYIVGHDGNGATLWVDGVPTLLYDGNREFLFSGSDVEVKGNDVYVAVAGGDINSNDAFYWKNGELTNLNRGPASHIFMGSLAVGKEDVYLAGYGRLDQDDWAYLWTNKTPTDLSGNKRRSWAHSVKIVEK